MSLSGEQVLLRIYLQSADRAPHTPTYERIIKAARAEGMAGCTVLRGIMGFGARGMIGSSGWAMIEHVPIIIEIVDGASRIQHFIQTTLWPLMIGGIITLERANIMMYRDRRQNQPGSLQLASLLSKPLSTVPQFQLEGTNMAMTENGILLRIFAGESDKSDDGKPLYEAILQEARKLGLAGATVLRGIEGFGANSVVHKAKLLEMSSDLPIVIEMVETEEKIKPLLPYLERVVQEGMITMEYVSIVFYRHAQRAS
jgi:hypothetical protein